jgi:hypothetical protein
MISPTFLPPHLEHFSFGASSSCRWSDPTPAFGAASPGRAADYFGTANCGNWRAALAALDEFLNRVEADHRRKLGFVDKA